jgi:hypothetical protein
MLGICSSIDIIESSASGLDLGEVISCSWGSGETLGTKVRRVHDTDMYLESIGTK